MAKRRVRIEDEVGGGLVEERPLPTDSARLLRQNPHSTDYREIRASFDDEGVPQDVLGPATIAEAGEESAYTDRQGQAVPGEPEAVSREAQEEITRRAREKKERVVMSPLYAIDKELEKLEGAGHYKPGKVRFIRKLVNQLGEDAMRGAVEEES